MALFHFNVYWFNPINNPAALAHSVRAQQEKICTWPEMLVSSKNTYVCLSFTSRIIHQLLKVRPFNFLPGMRQSVLQYILLPDVCTR